MLKDLSEVQNLKSDLNKFDSSHTKANEMFNTAIEITDNERALIIQKISDFLTLRDDSVLTLALFKASDSEMSLLWSTYCSCIKPV